MIVRRLPIYIGLLQPDGTEPQESTGYARVPVGDVIVVPEEVHKIPFREQIVFPDVTGAAYEVTHLAAFFREQEGEAAYIWPLPEPVELKPGMIPFIHNGKLYKGVEVTAKAIAKSEDMCRLQKTEVPNDS